MTKNSDLDTISDLDSEAEQFDLLDLTIPTYNPGNLITSKIFLTHPSENLPPNQNISFHSNFLPETTTTYFCNLPEDSSIDTPVTLPPTNQTPIFATPPRKKVKKSHISSNHTQSYPDLSTSE